MNAVATVTLDDGCGRWPGQVLGYRADGLALFQYTHPDGTAGGTVAAPRHLITGAPPAPKPAEFTSAAATTTSTAARMTADRWTVLDIMLTAGGHGVTDAELPTHLIDDRRTVERMGLCSYEGARRPDPTGKALHVYTLSRAGRQAHRAWQLVTITPTEGGNLA